MYLLLWVLPKSPNFPQVSLTKVSSYWCWTHLFKHLWLVCCHDWQTVIVGNSLNKFSLITLSWYSFSFNTCFFREFSLIKRSLLVIMEYALLNKEEITLTTFLLVRTVILLSMCWHPMYQYRDLPISYPLLSSYMLKLMFDKDYWCDGISLPSV